VGVIGDIMKPHKWAKEIKAWADGAEIEYRKIGTEKWLDEKEDFPYWDSVIFEYRIKPQPKEPQYLYVYKDRIGLFGLSQTKEHKDITYIGKIKLETEDE
jgi:hypothetical protein